MTGIWSIPSRLVIVMELADGTLRDWLQTATDEGQAGIPLDELLRYLAETAEGLDFLNQNRHRVGNQEGGLRTAADDVPRANEVAFRSRNTPPRLP
jgi:hypothetical protein